MTDKPSTQSQSQSQSQNQTMPRSGNPGDLPSINEPVSIPSQLPEYQDLPVGSQVPQGASQGQAAESPPPPKPGEDEDEEDEKEDDEDEPEEEPPRQVAVKSRPPHRGTPAKTLPRRRKGKRG